MDDLRKRCLAASRQAETAADREFWALRIYLLDDRETMSDEERRRTAVAWADVTEGLKILLRIRGF